MDQQTSKFAAESSFLNAGMNQSFPSLPFDDAVMEATSPPLLKPCSPSPALSFPASLPRLLMPCAEPISATVAFAVELSVAPSSP